MQFKAQSGKHMNMGKLMEKSPNLSPSRSCSIDQTCCANWQNRLQRHDYQTPPPPPHNLLYGGVCPTYFPFPFSSICISSLFSSYNFYILFATSFRPRLRKNFPPPFKGKGKERKRELNPTQPRVNPKPTKPIPVIRQYESSGSGERGTYNSSE